MTTLLKRILGLESTDENSEKARLIFNQLTHQNDFTDAVSIFHHLNELFTQHCENIVVLAKNDIQSANTVIGKKSERITVKTYQDLSQKYHHVNEPLKSEIIEIEGCR